MDEHFVTVVLHVPEFVANDMRLWHASPRSDSVSFGGYIVQSEWVRTIGTLPDLHEAAHLRGSSCPCGTLTQECDEPPF